jgi:hypothetical protein
LLRLRRWPVESNGSRAGRGSVQQADDHRRSSSNRTGRSPRASDASNSASVVRASAMSPTGWQFRMPLKYGTTTEPSSDWSVANVPAR